MFVFVHFSNEFGTCACGVVEVFSRFAFCVVVCDVREVISRTV